MAKDAIYERRREVRTFAYLAHGANVLILKTEQDPKGSNFTLMSSLLLSAFAFEACLNDLGSKKIKFWKEIEPIKIMAKYSVLCKEFGVSPDFSRRPYQTLKALFKFRNAIAHAKPIILEKPKEISSQDDPHVHKPKTEWEKYCKLENAKRAKEDILEIITELHTQAGLGGYPVIHDMTIGSVSPKTPNN